MFILLNGNSDMVYEEQRCQFCSVKKWIWRDKEPGYHSHYTY